MPKVEVDTGPAIRALYDSKGVMTGDFTLRSGIKSPIYWNLRNLRSFPKEKRIVVATYLEILKGLKFNHVADIPTAASPIVASIADKLEISQITPRQVTKDHGLAVAVDGAFNVGEIAVAIDDVATSGGSMMEGIKVLRGEKVVINDAVVLLDRMQGAEATLNTHGINLHYAFTMREALLSLSKDPSIPDSEREIFELQAAKT